VLAWLSVWSEVQTCIIMAQLMPLTLTVSCFSKIQIGFTFLVPADPGSPGQRAVKRVCDVCVCGVCRRDRTLQLLTYKLVPGLYRSTSVSTLL